MMLYDDEASNISRLTLEDSYPPDTPEKQKALGEFFATFPPPKIAGYVPDYVDAVKAHSPSVSKLAMLGVSLIYPPSS